MRGSGRLLVAGGGGGVGRVDARRGRRERPGSMRWSRVASAIGAERRRLRRVCDLLCALPAATGGPTLFAKNSDRPPDERQVLRVAPATARRRDRRGPPTSSSPPHPTATLGVFGSRPAWGWGLEQGVNEAGRRGRQRHDLHHARPADGARRAHRHGPRAARARAVRPGRRRRRADRAAAARGRAGRVRARRGAPAVLVVVPPRRPGRAPSWWRRRATRWRSRRSTESARPRTARRSPRFDADHRHPRQPVEPLVDPRLARVAGASWPSSR